MPGQGRLGDKANVPVDTHGCPLCPHPGTGPAILGSPDVNVNKRPALRVDDPGLHAACCGPNSWTATQGCMTVFINGKGAHRLGDQNRHCGGMGQLIEGSPNVIVGESSGGGAGATARSGGGSSGGGGGAGGGGGTGGAGGAGAGSSGSGAAAAPGLAKLRAAAANQPAPVAIDARTIEVVVVSGAGAPQRQVRFQLRLPDGSTREGATSGDGALRFDQLTQAGTAHLVLPDYDQGTSAPPRAYVAGALPYAARGVDVQVGRRTEVEIHRRLALLEVEDALFRTDSAVVLPDGQDPTLVDRRGRLKPPTGPGAIAVALRYFDEHAGKRVLVAGHTDTVGTAAYNLALSELRAACVQAALVGDRAGFAAVAQQRHKVADYQQILAWVARTRGWACDPGPVDGDHGTATSRGVRGFKAAWSAAHPGEPPLAATGPQSGRVDEPTWAAMFDCYQDALQDELGETADGVGRLQGQLQFLAPNPVGCGEFHPIDHLGRNNYASQKNRRVEVLFFDLDEVPDMACHAGACNPRVCQIYDVAQYDREPIPPMSSTKFWAATWDVFQIRDNESDRMVLRAPGLSAGTELAFTVFQIDNAGGPRIAIGTLSVLATAERGEAAWASWFDYDRNDIRKGRDFKFVFAVEGGGRRIEASGPVIFHPTQLQLSLIDGDDRPLAQRPYRLEIDGRALTDRSDAAGALTENIRGGATEARLVYGDPALWTVPVRIVPMPGPDTLTGAQMRLNNLGLCAPEAVHGNLDQQTRRALLRFQELQRIPLTGRLDSTTSARLRQVHGS